MEQGAQCLRKKKMSQKKTKKTRKEIRKAVRANIGEGAEALSTIVRKRPKVVPKFLWIILYLPLFKRKYLKYIYKNIK